MLTDACVLAFDDNNGARFSAIRAMSKHYDINALLSFFWVSATQLSCQIWMDRVSSRDNPADCLTKDGLDASHLSDAHDDTDSVDWVRTFSILEQVLRARSVPSWDLVREFIDSRSDSCFQ